MPLRRRPAAAALGLLILVLVLRAEARGSSDEAWADFRTKVSAACTAEAKKIYTDPLVVVDPFGSASYGIALVYARTPAPRNAPPEHSLTTAVCVYDKRTHRAELSGGFRTAP